MQAPTPVPSLDAPLDPPTAALVRLAAAAALGSPASLDEACAGAMSARVPPAWVDELLLQTRLMAGYPRALEAFTRWRDVSGVAAPADDDHEAIATSADHAAAGERTCHVVYGRAYHRLRAAVRALHPALDAFMVVEGYGRTLSRPGLDLARRELCTVAQTIVLDAPRQQHSHLRGALHAGATALAVSETVHLACALAAPAVAQRATALWQRLSAGHAVSGAA